MSVARDKRPLRWILRKPSYKTKRGRMLRMQLSCGHVKKVKVGKAPKRQARCMECYLEAERRERERNTTPVRDFKMEVNGHKLGGGIDGIDAK
jgi:hypothetical protein